jgi:hypothetical protein
MAGPSKCACLLADLTCAQDGVEEQYVYMDSKEEPKGAMFQYPSSVEENSEDLEWCH